MPKDYFCYLHLSEREKAMFFDPIPLFKFTELTFVPENYLFNTEEFFDNPQKEDVFEWKEKDNYKWLLSKEFNPQKRNLF